MRDATDAAVTPQVEQAEPQEASADGEPWLEELTPRQIVGELDKYIIGQDDAKKAVAIALRNRWRRQRVGDDLRDEILPSNLILQQYLDELRSGTYVKILAP